MKKLIALIFVFVGVLFVGGCDDDDNTICGEGPRTSLEVQPPEQQQR